jgi:hypothetical protein
VSAGPIKQAREGSTVKPVSVPDNARVCMATRRDGGPATYCGRGIRHTASLWRKVTCTDCRAAARADGVKIELKP